MPASSRGRDAGEQVIERQHRVRLAAAEVGLQLDHRVAALAGEAPHRADQQPLQALGEVGAAEELDRVRYSSVPSPRCTCHRSAANSACW